MINPIHEGGYAEKKVLNMNGKNHNHKKSSKHRVITMLDRGEVDFLDKLGKDALFSAGHKLSHNVILRGLIDFAIEMGLSGENIDSVEKLKEKLLREVEERLKKPF